MLYWGVSSESGNAKRRKFCHDRSATWRKNNFRPTTDSVASFFQILSTEIGPILKILLSELAESLKNKRGREEEEREEDSERAG